MVIKLEITNENDFEILKKTFISHPNKFISLDLSNNTITTIPNNAFQYCHSLTSVTIPDSVTSIGEYAFSDCASLTSVTIGRGVKSIEACAFIGCISLASVTFQGAVPSRGISDYYYTFPGDLRDKFYEHDPTNGTPGTYTTTVPVSDYSTWTKQ